MREAIFYFRLLGLFIARFKWLLVLGVLFGGLLFVIVRFISPSLSRDISYVGYVGRYRSDDLPESVLSLISDGLTYVDEAGQAQPALSDRWETSENGKVWTFHLDPDRQWQDGTKLTSSDIQYTFESATIERPDSSTIKFTLEAPYAPFPLIVSKPVFKRGLLGTGDWKVAHIFSNGSFIEKIELVQGTKTKILRFYPTEEQLKIGFQLGEIDEGIDLFDPSPFNSWNTVSVKEQVSSSQFVALFFNNQSDLLKDKSMRQALSYAIDKTQFKSERAISPLSPNSWAFNPQVKAYDYDLDHAKKLLNDIPKEAREGMRLTISTTPLLLKDAELIGRQWRELGIATTVQVSPEIPSEFEVFLGIYGIPDDPDQYQTWHSTQDETNVTNFQNPRIDKLLEDGRMELDIAKRKKLYIDFQRFLLEEAPASFLYHPKTYAIERK